MRSMAVLLAFVSVVGVHAQWTSDPAMGVAAGFGRTLIAGVGCDAGRPVLSVRFTDDGQFSSGVVVAVFDDGEPLDVEFANRGQQLNGTASSGVGAAFLRLLMQSSSVTLGVGRRGRSQPVVDAISLRGSSRAIRNLPCI